LKIRLWTETLAISMFPDLTGKVRERSHCPSRVALG
jgi:hypothetical protein